MATSKFTTPSRRETVREFQSIAVEARCNGNGNRKHWTEARRLWLRYATATEQRKAPAVLTTPWPLEG